MYFKWNETTLKNYIKTKLRPKETFKRLQFCQKLVKKECQTDHDFFSFKNTSKQARQSCYSFLSKLYKKYINFLSIKIRLKKIHGNEAQSSSIEIISKKVRRNDVDFCSIEIAQTKYVYNDVHFWPIEISSKRYVEMTLQFVDFFFQTYRRNTDIESKLIRRCVSVG